MFGRGAAGAGVIAAASTASTAKAETPPPPGASSEHPVGTIRWAQDQILAGHRVRQRCWKDGAGCENAIGMVEFFGPHYEKGIASTTGLPVFIEFLHGTDWEIV